MQLERLVDQLDSGLTIFGVSSRVLATTSVVESRRVESRRVESRRVESRRVESRQHYAQEKCEAKQRKADAKVRGKLLANAVVAEVRRRFVHQADKARLAVEKLQAERDASRPPRKVRMRLGVSAFFSLVIA